MKKKFGLWLNIATICLCVCAIAIGVYAAQSATLSVTGSVGFKAHGVEYTASVRAKGYASNADGTGYVSAWQDLNLTLTNNTLTLPAMYFTDLESSVSAIEIEVSVTNSSKFNVLLSVDEENTTYASTLFDMEHTGNKVLDKTGGTKTTDTMTFTLRLKSTESFNNTTSPTSNLSIKIKLEKEIEFTSSTIRQDVTSAIKEFTTTEMNAIKTNLNNQNLQFGPSDYVQYTDDILCYAERYPYYMEMGTDQDGAKVRWLIVGYNDSNNVLKVITTEDRTALAKGLMLKDKTYYLLSEKALYTKDTTNYGISFQNSYTNSGSYLNTAGKNANDYATSNIRAYLNNSSEVYREASLSNGVYSPKTSDGALTPFETMYNLTSSNLYSKIQARSLEQLYADNDSSETGIFSTDLTDKDKFWLLSQTEAIELFDDDIISGEYDNSYASSITTVQGVTNGSPCWWWLRSPGSSRSDYARGVSGYGSVDDNSYVTVCRRRGSCGFPILGPI